MCPKTTSLGPIKRSIVQEGTLYLNTAQDKLFEDFQVTGESLFGTTHNSKNRSSAFFLIAKKKKGQDLRKVSTTPDEDKPRRQCLRGLRGYGASEWFSFKNGFYHDPSDVYMAPMLRVE